MLLAIILCVLGIVLESVKWPLDRTSHKERFAMATGLGESAIHLVGLVLGHPVVRWLLALAVAGVVVATVLGSPQVLAKVKAAKESNQLSIGQVEILSGVAVSILMCALALGARRLAR